MALGEECPVLLPALARGATAAFAAGRGVFCAWSVRSYVRAARLIFPLDGESVSTGSLSSALPDTVFGAGCFARVAVAEPLGGCSGAGEGATLLLREAAGVTGAACLPLSRLGGFAPRSCGAGGIEVVAPAFSVCAGGLVALQESACLSTVRRTGEAEPPRMSRWQGVVAATRILAGSDSVLDMLVPSLLMRSARGAFLIASSPFWVIWTHSPYFPLCCVASPSLTTAAVSGCGLS